jgi:ATP-dependent 26S proteasome regulatory subunit
VPKKENKSFFVCVSKRRLQMPDEKQRREIIGDIASRINLSKDVSLSDLALRTASFSPRDLKSVVDLSVDNAMRRVLARPEPRGGKGSQYVNN